MQAARHARLTRREFLQTSAVAASAVACGIAPAAAEDAKGTHNMLMFGERAVFLSHLPMFHGLSADGAAFASPHRYQVILEATLAPGQQELYLADRRRHPGTPFYTIGPEQFVLSRLFTPAAAPRLTAFTATVFRGHLEADPKSPVSGLADIQVGIARVVHGRMFDPRAARPAALEYLLFGRGRERFLAHAIFAPPDFDHVLSAGTGGAEVTDRDLDENIRIVVPDRKNVAAERLRQGQRVEALLHIGSRAPGKVQLDVGPQIYFEEGELLVPPTFDPTPEERRE
jgi:hypothetical protein